MNCIMESATDMLVKAVKYDCDNRRVEALSLYTEGINKLLDVAKSKNHFVDSATYMMLTHTLFQLNQMPIESSTTTRRSRSS